MRLVVFGTPVAASHALYALVDIHDVVLVVTRPDKRRGRGDPAMASPLGQAAASLGLPMRKPARAGELTDEIRDLGADLGVVVAYGQLIPPTLLEVFPLGLVNVHYSLLPRWRGAAPVERAILAGDDDTGVCIMALEEGLDTGPVYARERTPIGADETAGELHARLTPMGTDLLVRTLPVIGAREPEPQAGEPTYADKLTVEEFRLDPSRQADDLTRVVRAGNPRPGAWLSVQGKRVKVLRAHCVEEHVPLGTITASGVLGTSHDALVLDDVQPEGKQVMPGAAWRRGHRGRELSIDTT
jgi:methionyl-tRNA formyltransferase